MANSVFTICCSSTPNAAINTSSLRLPNQLQPSPTHLISRRNAAFIFTGSVLGLLNNVVDRPAEAAARRPPPPPPQDKKDPNLSGVQAKVLASRKRKEAMKEAMAKLRDKGKAVAVDQPPPE